MLHNYEKYRIYISDSHIGASGPKNLDLQMQMSRVLILKFAFRL